MIAMIKVFCLIYTQLIWKTLQVGDVMMKEEEEGEQAASIEEDAVYHDQEIMMQEDGELHHELLMMQEDGEQGGMMMMMIINQQRHQGTIHPIFIVKEAALVAIMAIHQKELEDIGVDHHRMIDLHRNDLQGVELGEEGMVAASPVILMLGGLTLHHQSQIIIIIINEAVICH